MNRHDRRKAARGSKPMSRKQSVLANIERNGITAENLREVEKMAYQRGREQGIEDAGEPLLRTLYAGVCLALNDLHGFGAKRCRSVLHRAEEYIRDTLATEEAEDEVFKRMGYRIEYKDPFDRVQEVDEA